MKPVILIALFVLFMTGMDLYALRGIQYLFSPGQEGSLLFYYIYWGITLVMMLTLIFTGSRFQQLRDPSRFFGIMLIMGIFLMLYVPKLIFNAAQMLGDLASIVPGLLGKSAGKLRTYFLVPGAVLGLFTFIAFGMGMARGRTHLKVFRVDVKIQALPGSFQGAPPCAALRYPPGRFLQSSRVYQKGGENGE